MDHVSEGVQVSSADEIMLYYNAACEKIENISRDECLGKSLKEIYSKTNLTKDNTLHRVVRRTKVPVLNSYNQYNTKNKLTEVFSSTWSFDIDEELSGVFSILREAAPARNYLEDITLLKQKEKSELPAHENKAPKYYIFDDIIHTSKAMADCIAYAKKVAPTDANIMLYGETGSGKELLHKVSIMPVYAPRDRLSPLTVRQYPILCWKVFCLVQKRVVSLVRYYKRIA